MPRGFELNSAALWRVLDVSRATETAGSPLEKYPRSDRFAVVYFAGLLPQIEHR